jgi:hypothetical protein
LFIDYFLKISETAYVSVVITYMVGLIKLNLNSRSTGDIRLEGENQATGENFIMWNFKTYTAHHIILGPSDRYVRPEMCAKEKL